MCIILPWYIYRRGRDLETLQVTYYRKFLAGALCGRAVDIPAGLGGGEAVAEEVLRPRALREAGPASG